MIVSHYISSAPLPLSHKRAQRDSNLELYRIILMLLIIAHHYVVNSGLYQMIVDAPLSVSSTAMLLFGAWGKTGINCFVLITGYFMCRSNFSIHKFIRLYLQIVFYSLLFYLIFCFTGCETFSPVKAFLKMLPFKCLADDFISCFLVFYLTIPFLNILINNLDRKKHLLLMALLLTVFTLLPSVPNLVRLSFNYIEWFVTLYIIASYIRLYGFGIEISHRQWLWISFMTIFIASFSVVGLFLVYKLGYFRHHLSFFFISDSNKILALAVSVATFMWFKGLKIPSQKLINTLGAATFGILLIHANSDTMRQWLWCDTINCTVHFTGLVSKDLTYATMAVIIVFITCAAIEILRSKYIEPYLLEVSNRVLNRKRTLSFETSDK